MKLRLRWESLQVAEFIIDGGWLNSALYSVDRGLRRGSTAGRFQPERDGMKVHAGGSLGHRLQRPF
ncbi:hypothetical protein ACN28I_26260 [Archangium gephyra]|uniref:hypothetical protein n=1 Tax=Archangium gephyra TaxID=48 RepID=UPI003B79A63A